MNLPEFDFKIRKENDKYQIFDRIRKVFVRLTPEEIVRQTMVSYLIENLGYPINMIANEVTISYNGMNKRCDTLVYDRKFSPLMIIEYKAEHIPITKTVFDQICVYNQKLSVPYLLVSNGQRHVMCKVDVSNNDFSFMDHIPSYDNLIC